MVRLRRGRLDPNGRAKYNWTVSMTTFSRNLLLACAALGLAASSTSSYVHYQLLTQPSYTSFCDVNETVSCTQAYLSRYGSFMGVPVALAGVTFFVAGARARGRRPRGRRHAAESAPGYIFALSTVGLAFVLYLGWASYVVLKAFCLLCAITYVAVIAHVHHFRRSDEFSHDHSASPRAA